MEFLQGARVIVTGAASGIGREAALAAADAGAQLALFDRDGDRLHALAREMRAGCVAHAATLDVTDEQQVEDAFAEVVAMWGGVDVLLHVAGIMRNQMSDLRDISLEDWTAVQSVNLTGAFLAARAVSRSMIPAGEGVIVLVGSPAGVTSPSGSISYGASKGGVSGLAMTLQRHLDPHGIRVHNFCPGSVDTPLFRRSLDAGVENGASRQQADATRAAAVSAERVGRALVLLASPLASDFTGAIFTR